MRRPAGATPRCKRARGQKRSVERPPRNANGYFGRPKWVAPLEMPLKAHRAVVWMLVQAESQRPGPTILSKEKKSWTDEE
jgi:hypothetical protein